MILRLLILDADSRLGAGLNEYNSIVALKKHKFFKGIDFDKLNEMKVPFLDEFIIKPKEIKCKSTVNTSCRHNTVKIIKIGILDKKSPWFHYNTRRVVLDDSPKLEYKDPERNSTKVTGKLNRV